MVDNYYAILGVDRNATIPELKSAYKKKALKWHPDRKGGDGSKFQKVALAYEVLMDPESKYNYDHNTPEDVFQQGDETYSDFDERKRVFSGSKVHEPSPKRQKREDVINLNKLGADDESLWSVYEATPNFGAVGNSLEKLIIALNHFEEVVANYRAGRRIGEGRTSLIVKGAHDYASFANALADAYERDEEVAQRECQVKNVASRLLREYGTRGM